MRWGLLLVLWAGCFPTRSDGLICSLEASNPIGCPDGRVCEDGFCIVAPDAMPIAPSTPDAPAQEPPPPPMPDAPPPPRPCTGGDANVVDNAGNCFVVFKAAPNAPKTHAAAATACVALDMTLAKIDSEDSNTKVQTLVAGVEAWIGASDTAAEGTFVWADATPLDFKKFRAGEPNDGGDGPGGAQEDCLIIQGQLGGVWDDRPCGLAGAYVCGF